MTGAGLPGGVLVVVADVPGVGGVVGVGIVLHFYILY